MYITEIEKRYGNGSITTYRRSSNSYGRAMVEAIDITNPENFRHQIYSDDEKRRLRHTKSRSNAKQRILSTDEYKYFVTFTTSNIELALDGKKLLDAVHRYLIARGIKAHTQLEAFYDANKGFHVHCLTDKPVDFTEWVLMYGSDIENAININENWDEREKNLYCEEIYSSLESCADYITKNIDITKDRLEELYPNSKVHVYKSNVKKIKATTFIRVINDETGEIINVFDNSSIENDVNNINSENVNLNDIVYIDVYVNFNKEKIFTSLNSLLNYKKAQSLLAIVTNADQKSAFASVAHSLYNNSCDDHCCKNDEEKKKDVLKVEKRTNIVKNFVLRSYTGTKDVPIPLKNDNFNNIFCGFLLNYIGWVENIPIKNKRK